MADAAADGCDDSVGSYSWHLAGGSDENICRYYTKNELEDLLFKDNITSEIFNDSLDILKKMYKVNIQYIKYISEGNNKIAN